jgi:hypothetical protein
VTNENLPLGTAKEISRTATEDGHAKAMIGQYSFLGYIMNLGFVAKNDPRHNRMIAAVLITDPLSWTQMEPIETVLHVVDSLSFQTDLAVAAEWEEQVSRPHRCVLAPDPEDELLP